MLNEIPDLDLFNYYAVCFLELVGSFAPSQAEIDRMVHSIKQIFKLHMHKMLNQLAVNQKRSCEMD